MTIIIVTPSYAAIFVKMLANKLIRCYATFQGSVAAHRWRFRIDCYSRFSFIYAFCAFQFSPGNSVAVALELRNPYHSPSE